MKFNTNPAIKRIHDIHNILLKEPLSAYEVANQMLCKRPIIYFYINHMLDSGFIREIDKIKVARYQSVVGVTLPGYVVETLVYKGESEDKKRIIKRAKNIVPFRDEWLFSLFGLK
jgi:hypothetical protein